MVREAGREVKHSFSSLEKPKSKTNQPAKRLYDVKVGSLLVATPATENTQCRLDESQVVSRYFIILLKGVFIYLIYVSFKIILWSYVLISLQLKYCLQIFFCSDQSIHRPPRGKSN